MKYVYAIQRNLPIADIVHDYAELQDVSDALAHDMLREVHQALQELESRGH